MKILNIFDAARDGTLDDLKRFYDGNINQVDEELDINLLCIALANDKNPNEKIKIINFLIEEGIDLNYSTKKNNRNALHMFYFNVLRPTPDYSLEVTKIFINNGLNINAVDRYNAIPFKYAITINKLPTNDNKTLYKLLLDHGSNYKLEDVFNKSCLDYCKEYSWRNDLVDIIKEYEHGKINLDYGGFVVSNNVIEGKPIRYTFREKSDIPKLNGWTIYSIEDNDDYVNNPDNFKIMGATSIIKIAPVMLEIFDAPYGTDICWLYEEGVHIGFYDLVNEKEISISEILSDK